MTPFLLLLVVTTLFSSPVCARKKPSNFFSLCKQSDPNFSSCVKNTLMEAEPTIVKGIPELDLQPLDPLFISKMSMNQGQDNFKLTMIYSNLTITGLKDVQLQDFIVSNNFTWVNFTSFVKYIHFEGEYSMDGRILLLPIKGNGQATLDFDDVSFNGAINFEEYVKKGEKYIRCKQFIWKINPVNARSYFSNLFNGDKQLGETTNKFFNDNWKEAFETYRQLPETGFGEVFKEFVNRALSLHPKKLWLLD